jgi:tetratricopeptide (TPR) repeat protein
MRIPLLILLASLTITAKISMAQSILYFEWIHQADSLTKHKEYKKAAAFYDKALPQANRKYISYDWYNAVCIYALAGENEKAFKVLTQLANMPRFYEGKSLIEDAGLTSLQQDRRWENIRQLFLRKDSLADMKINHTLKAELRHAFDEDQRYRRPLDTVIQKYGANSPQVDSLEDNMAKADSLNLILVRSILDKYGWLGPDVIGLIGSSTLFAVIQHADLVPGVQEKYLSYMRRAVEKGDAAPSDLALLEDRILVGKHKPQLYGSQITTNDQGIGVPFPIADSLHVDSRRAKMGLEPLKYYLQLFNPTH